LSAISQRIRREVISALGGSELSAHASELGYFLSARLIHVGNDEWNLGKISSHSIGIPGCEFHAFGIRVRSY